MLERLRVLLRMVVAHPHYKLLAVLLALSAWWYVTASDPAQETVSVPVDWIEPPDLIATGLPGRITVVLEGPRSALRRVDKNALRLPIDLATVSTELGEHSLDLAGLPIENLPSTVQLTEIRPESVTFTLDEVEERSVNVEPKVVGEPAEGWMVVGVKLEPSVVTVRGPRSLLVNLTTIETFNIDVSGLRFDRRFKTQPDLAGVEVVGDATIEARVDVEPRTESRVFSEVPVVVRGRTGWVAEPTTVRVRAEGPAASLRQISASDVIAQIYLPDEPVRGLYQASFEATEGVRAEVIVPSELVEVVDVQPETIKVIRQ